MKTNPLKLNRDDWNIGFTNISMTIVKMIDAFISVLIAGRGTSKTTEFLAYRVECMAHAMPQFSIAYMADTYVNLQTNLIPTLVLGLRRHGYVEEKDFIVGKEPPKKWPKPHLRTPMYNNTITFWNGFKIYLVSADRPSITAGISFCHLIIDEAKYIKKNTFDRVVPTLRDNPLNAPTNTHYFQGMTITTDMPNPLKRGEYDWVELFENKETSEKNKLILQTAIVINQILNGLVKKGYDYDYIQNDNNYQYYLKILNRLRMNSYAYYKISSYSNADILGLTYFNNLIDTLDVEDLNSSVLSIKAKKGDKESYVPKFDPKIHTFSDGYAYESYYDNFGISADTVHTAQGLKYYRPSDPLYGAMDFGNMNSVSFSQERMERDKLTNRTLKEMCVLSPQWFPDLAKKFTDFFACAKNKKLHLYYDRAGNNYGPNGHAALFKKAIEEIDNDWDVILESLDLETLYHKDVYEILQVVFDRASPIQLLLDEYNCRDTIGSIELSPAKKNSKGQYSLVKTSEAKPLHKLPSESTNYATGYFYMVVQRYGKYLPDPEDEVSVSSMTPR